MYQRINHVFVFDWAQDILQSTNYSLPYLLEAEGQRDTVTHTNLPPPFPYRKILPPLGENIPPLLLCLYQSAHSAKEILRLLMVTIDRDTLHLKNW